MSAKAQSLSDVQFESNIVWLEDINNIPYVREHFEQSASRRKGKLKYGDYHIIGYSELESDAPSRRPGCFARRVFWLSNHDRFYDPEGTYKVGCPMEAVDPLTITHKVLGKLTQRAWNGTLPKDVY
ncbi:MAG: DUF6009 family protein [Nostoc sp. ChiQUE01a]|nr:DUF6009 family protein [Nostoc sp. ChiQUE01a]